MNLFLEAFASVRSTVLCGPFGRHPRLVRFYLDAIPELESASGDELVFWHRGQRRHLYVLLEPPFDAFLPPDRWFLALTSHSRLRWHALSTRFVRHDFPRERDGSVPSPRPVAPRQKFLLPPAGHLSPLLLGDEPVRVDLLACRCAHEAYLRLLTLFDCLRPASQWSLSLPKPLRRELLELVPGAGGPYGARLLEALRSG